MIFIDIGSHPGRASGCFLALYICTAAQGRQYSVERTPEQLIVNKCALLGGREGSEKFDHFESSLVQSASTDSLDQTGVTGQHGTCLLWSTSTDQLAMVSSARCGT